MRQEGKVHLQASRAAVQRLVRMGEPVAPLWTEGGSCWPQDIDCLVQLGRDRGAALLVQGEITPLGQSDSYTVTVRLIDVAQGAVVRQGEHLCEGCQGEALEDRVAEAVGALMETPPVHTHPLPPQPPAQPPLPTAGPAPVPPQPDEGKPLRIAGAVLLAVGATLAVGGLLLQVGHHLGWGRTVAESPSDSSLCWPGTQTGQWCLEPWVAPLVSGGGCFWQAGGAGSCWG
ncbi:MAG: hypothetical protein RMK29_08975 [Myxococcales bacterium]|nr:hypothetical protein [Myxococcales bacterium]